MPVFYTVADYQKDSTHRGYCADCGCTVFDWEYLCRSCRNKAVEEQINGMALSKNYHDKKGGKNE